jgi:hypothetical protein
MERKRFIVLVILMLLVGGIILMSLWLAGRLF